MSPVVISLNDTNGRRWWGTSGASLKHLPVGQYVHLPTAPAFHIPEPKQGPTFEEEEAGCASEIAYGHGFADGWNACRDAILAAAPSATASPGADDMQTLGEALQFISREALGNTFAPHVTPAEKNRWNLLLRQVADAAAAWKRIHTVLSAAPAAQGADVIDPESPNFKEGLSVGMSCERMLVAKIKNPTCDRCGACSAEDALDKCSPSDDSCPGSEFPLSQLWGMSKAAAPAVVADPFEPHWPEGLNHGDVFRLPCDDKGRNGQSWLEVIIANDGDVHLAMQSWEEFPDGAPDPIPAIRSRNYFGGGRNHRSHQALLWLAQAIRLDDPVAALNQGKANG